MPQQVDFYILSQPGLAPELFACRLAQKAYRLGERILLHASSEQQAAELDSLLWTFDDGSFVPHGRIGSPAMDTTLSPVAIGNGSLPDWPCTLLVNVGDLAPQNLENVPRVAEIIANREQAKAAGRARYRAWQNHGITPVVHTI